MLYEGKYEEDKNVLNNKNNFKLNNDYFNYNSFLTSI